jgi:hypothetical protein
MFFKRISIRGSGRLLARFGEAAKEEEIPQGRGRAATTQLAGRDGPADLADAEDGESHGVPRQWWEPQCPAGGGPHEEIEGFIRLEAPTISYSDQPLNADDWLRVTETKLDLTVYTDEECVAIAAHHLDGSASLDGTTMPPAT